MQEKLLKEIIVDFIGSGSEKIVDLLYAKKNVNEFLIAKKLNMTINQTRNMLYKLADRGLVGFIRKKDKKKGGWYTYFWTLNVRKGLERYKEKIDKEVARLKGGLSNRELGRYFFCKNCGIEYNEENAMLNDYTCPECGEVLELRENEELIKGMKSELAKYEDILSKINTEIASVEEKEQKTKDRRLKVEKKKKEEERLKKKKERAKEREKLKKATGKTVKENKNKTVSKKAKKTPDKRKKR
jgi:transcription factor E